MILIKPYARRSQKKSRASLEVGGFGKLGKGPEVSHSLKKKGFGLVNNSTHAVPVKHPHKSLLVHLAPKRESPPRTLRNRLPQATKPPSSPPST
jgi:hypothetical protein